MRRVLVLTLVLVGGASGTLAAQDPPASPPAQRPAARGARAGQAPAGNPQQVSRIVHELLDLLAVQRVRPRLQFSREQWPQFLQHFQDLQSLRRQHRITRVRLIGELRQLSRPDALTDPAALIAKTKAVDDLEVTWIQEEARAMAAVDQVLTVLQRARLRVFEEDMELYKLELIAQVKGRGAPAPKAPPIDRTP
jgi:hypothetical protein